jgi:4-hydroxyacetophenone monooxygenase
VEALAGLTDEALADIVEAAHVPSLLAALAHLTGEAGLTAPELRPPADGIRDLGGQGGLSDVQLAVARRRIVATLGELRDGETVPTPRGDDALVELMQFATGAPDLAGHAGLLAEELAVHDLRAPTWDAASLAPGRVFRVLIIGAGMSGILAAHRLHQAGVTTMVVDKNDDVGGTWFENTYPGCRVDITNHVYSYSFAQKHDWPGHHSEQRVLLDYFRQCAIDLGVYDNIRFGTEVVSLTWDDERSLWSALVRTTNGEATIETEAVISAVGQLNRPKWPTIAGMADFAGPAFHSAEWDHRVDLTGQRVAVIGTGSSAAQFVPEIARDAAAVTIFQRTPNWFFIAPNYRQPVDHRFQWLLTNIPNYHRWYRFWCFWRGTESVLPSCVVDPDWEPKDRSVSEANEALRQLLVMALQAQYADRPDLAAKVVPDYPPSAKRIIVDDGLWSQTLQSPHVELVTEPIAEVTVTGVRTSDGVEHEADVIIYGTGFQASEFLTPMRVVGREGVDLHQQWGGNARAYLGITVPHFPNFFCLYGPNTNIVVNGSIIYFSECEVRYVVDCVRLLLETGTASIECRTDVHDAYNERIDAGNLQMAWGVANVNSWYKSASGRVAQNWPFSLLEYWQQTLIVDAADYRHRNRRSS